MGKEDMAQRKIVLEEGLNIEYEIEKIQEIAENDSVVLDMQNIKKISARGITTLLIMAYLIYNKIKIPVCLNNISEEIMKYLTQSKFWNVSYISSIDHFDKIQYYSKQKDGLIFFPIRLVRNDDELLDVNREFFERQKEWVEISAKVKNGLLNALNELGDNALEHSALAQYKKGEFYTFIEENGDTIVLVVLDMGIGFRNSLSSVYEDITTDLEALCGVLNKNMTSRIDQGGGAGFYTIKKLVNENNGTLRMQSGNAIVEYRNGVVEKSYQIQANIIGSCILVEQMKVKPLDK